MFIILMCYVTDENKRFFNLCQYSFVSNILQFFQHGLQFFVAID